ncbi:MAG TPA: hypothetical protein PLY93_09925 [Turneriella sp.]|nr:hypothetical protein [Turneriella sp.]
MKAAPFVLFTAALGFMACGGLKGQIKESRAQSRSATAAAVYGEKLMRKTITRRY